MSIVLIRAKLAGMRKPQEFIVYPRRGEYVQVQSDHAIGQFDPITGMGILNWRGSNAKYGVHLSRTLGAEAYQFPRAFVLMCLEMRPNSGDQIGPNVYVA